jgi:hypothetical protein
MCVLWGGGGGGRIEEGEEGEEVEGEGLSG